MNRIKLTTDIIYNENVDMDITIIHISDIHFNKNTKITKLLKISDYINKLKPNYIMITGDTIDVPDITKDKVKIKELMNFLTSLGKICKVIISLGNHDVSSDNDYIFFNKINDLHNIYVLNNTNYQDEYIYVFGLTLPNEYYYNVTKQESSEILINKLDNIKNELIEMPLKKTKIALIHSPIKLTEKDVINRIKYFDIILSGHTHDGMVPTILKFLFQGNRGIISPNKKLFPKIAKGKIIKQVGKNKITIIISGGITKLSEQSGKWLSKFNFVYNKNINKIIIRKKRGIKYE